jgi:hypothetical protein
MARSDLAVRQAKATGKADTLPDRDGLSLAVTAAGGRTWNFRYFWAGKQKRTAARLADENTFEAVCRKWLKHRGLSLKEGRQTTLSIKLEAIFQGDEDT